MFYKTFFAGKDSFNSLLRGENNSNIFSLRQFVGTPYNSSLEHWVRSIKMRLGQGVSPCVRCFIICLLEPFLVLSKTVS